MSANVRLDRIDHPIGEYQLFWSDSTDAQYADVAALVEYANGTPSSALDASKRAVIGYWLRRDPTAADDNIGENLRCVFDLAQNRAVMEIYKDA